MSGFAAGQLSRLVLALLLALTACKPSGLVSADGDLRADPATVDFGAAFLNLSTTRPLNLSNTGHTPLAVTLQTAPPFGAPASLTLAGGETQAVPLTFSPAALGSASGLLTIKAPGAQLTLALTGTGIEPPACASTACREATLDPTSRQCVVADSADGTACDDGCVSGTCSAGLCAGAARSCDDQNPCTTDSCTTGEGCVHQPVVCASSDPCLVGSCTATGGCALSPVTDGASCGDADCTTARVCISGQCVTRAVPDGAACGPTSVCQAPGHCAGVCVQQPPVPLTHAWTYAAPSGKHLVGLVADPLGNTFTAECAPTAPQVEQCELVSFSPTGTERWRTAYPHTTNTMHGLPRDALMVAGNRIVSTIGPDWLDAFDVSTGAYAWNQHRLAADDPQGNWTRIVSFAFDGVDQVILILEGHSILDTASGLQPQVDRAVFGVSAATGSMRHTGFGLYFDGDASVVVDRHSVPFVDSKSHSGANWDATDVPDVEALTALEPSPGPYAPNYCCSGCSPLPDGGLFDCGEGSWGLNSQHELPLASNQLATLRAVYNGQLLASHPQFTHLLSSATGTVLPIALPLTTGEPSVVWGPPGLFLAPQLCSAPACYLLSVTSLDNSNRSTKTTFPPLTWLTPMWLTGRDSALLSLKPSTAPAELRELDVHGKLLMQCQLGGLDPTRHPVAGPVLTSGGYAMVTGVGVAGTDTKLEVWAVPGYAPASKGWVSPRGGPGLDLHEQ